MGCPVVRFEVMGTGRREAAQLLRPAVRLGDVEAALAEAEKLGATLLTGVFEVHPGVELAQFRDPEGNTVGLINERP